VKIQGLDADAVAREDEPLITLVPQCDRKHAAQTRKTFRIPLQESAQDDFRVATGAKPVSEGFELRADFRVIVNLAVKDQNGIKVVGEEGLIAAAQIDNF